MAYCILPILAILFMAVVGNCASESTTLETYWKKVTNTPMPLAIRHSLPHHEWTENKGDLKNRPVYDGLINTDYVWGGSYDPYKVGHSQGHVDPKRALYFFEKDMKVGSKLTFQFTKSILNTATFLTREKANAIPFSSDKLSEILRKFSLEPSSKEAGMVGKIIRECELSASKGEEKYCATSLESMIDFAISTVGNNFKAMSTVGRNHDKVVEYTITRVKKAAKEDKTTVCHKENYVYAVFYCHKAMTATSSYVVSLVGSNGSSVEAMTVCHKDTSGWNPKHLAFLALNVKPGTVPVCHFLTEEAIMWVPRN